MVDGDTFLTTLYVMVDDFCKTSLPPETHPGPEAALSRSETVTLAIFRAVAGLWQRTGLLPLYTAPFAPCLSPTTHAGAVQSAGAPALRCLGGLLSVSGPALSRPALSL
jgi:hypothetical protein